MYMLNLNNLVWKRFYWLEGPPYRLFGSLSDLGE